MPIKMVRHLFILLVIVCQNIFFYRQTKMDRIRRRQIGVRPFLRPERIFILPTKNSNSVRFGASERGEYHEFDFGDIHGTSTGNLLFLFHGSGAS